MKKPDLTDAEQDFRKLYVDAYLVMLNKANAYRAAKVEIGEDISHRSASSISCSAWSLHDSITRNSNLFEQRREELADKLPAARIESLIEEWGNKAFADPSTLVEHRVHCCRYCYGDGHRYQYTPAEQATRMDYWTRECEAHMLNPQRASDPGAFDPAGGDGYDKRKPPVKKCPECFGEGEASIVMHDSKNHPLYAGVKKTKDGVEVKMHDPYKYLNDLAKTLNAFESHQNAGSGEIHVHFDEKDEQA